MLWRQWHQIRLRFLNDLIALVIEPGDQAVGHSEIPCGIRSSDHLARRELTPYNSVRFLVVCVHIEAEASGAQCVETVGAEM